MEFLPVEGAVVIPIGGSEELLDQSQILVLVQRPILIGICPPKLPSCYCRAHFPPIESASMIAIEFVEARTSRRLDFV